MIWLLTSLGVLLLFLTTGLLAVRIQEMTGAEHSGTSESSILLGNKDALESKFVTIKDKDENEWALTTETIDLFQSTYRDASGEVVAQSSDGSKIIAPGTSGTYRFSVKNTGTTQLEYKLWLEKAFQATVDSGETVTLPVQVRLSSGSSESNTWLLGSSETDWVEATALKEIESDEAIQESAAQAIAENAEATADPQSPVTGTLDANEVISYTLEWQWPYESETDENDLLLSSSEDAEFTLKLIVAAEAEEPIVVPGGTDGQEPEPSTETPETEAPGTSTTNPETEAPGTSTSNPESEAPEPSTSNQAGEESQTNAGDSETEEDANSAEPKDTEVDKRDVDEKLELTSDEEQKGRHRFPWGWIIGLILGLLFLFWFIILLWRRITIDGYLCDENGKPMEGYQLVLEQSGLHMTKEAEVDEEGYFKIRRIPLGKKSLILEDEDGNELARNDLKLKRKGKLRIDDFLQIGEKKEDDGEKVYTEFDMRYRITGFEIYLHRHATSNRMEIEFDRWIARTWFKKKYTPDEEKKEQSSEGAGMR
jgi:hypothetical protein